MFLLFLAAEFVYRHDQKINGDDVFITILPKLQVSISHCRSQLLNNVLNHIYIHSYNINTMQSKKL